jgi:LAO/AO transport system kinase
MLSGAGDELQGIKRGIMEMADMIAITKADGQNELIAEGAKVSYQNAIHLFPPKPSGWTPRVVTCSALTNKGINNIWDIIMESYSEAVKSGYLNKLRKEQAVIRMHNTIVEYLNNSFYNNDAIRLLLPELEQQLYNGSITSYKAAIMLLDKYYKI